MRRDKRLVLRIFGWKSGLRRFKIGRPPLPVPVGARTISAREWLAAASEILDALADSGEWSIANPGNCLHGVPFSEPCLACQSVSEKNGGFPGDPDSTVHVECALCENLIEVRTGCRGIDDALSAGWELDGGGELICTRCSEARAEIVGDER